MAPKASPSIASQPPAPADLAASARLAEVDAWFVREVLPLQGALGQMIRHHWRHNDDHADLCQEVMVRAYESALKQGLPDMAKAFVFAIARNLLIDTARRNKVVSFESVNDLEDPLVGLVDHFTPERKAQSNEDLKHLVVALNALPARCRETVVLRKIEGLSQQEISQRMGVSEATVEKQVSLGMRAIANALAGLEVTEARSWLQRTLPFKRKT